MRTNKTKVKLHQGQVVYGLLLGYNAPWLIEMAGAVGFDFVVIDLEHEPINDESVTHLIRAAELADITPIVRLPLNDRVVTFLDVGAQGVQVPQVRDKAHAQAVVNATRFYPQGQRTYYALGRSAGYNMVADERQWTQRCNEELLVIGMIEDIQAVEQLPEILSVEGIDAFHVGPLDLAQSMGYPGQEEVERTIDKAVQQCRAAGKSAAVGAYFPANAQRVGVYLQKGVQIFNIASTRLLTHALGDFLEAVRR